MMVIMMTSFWRRIKKRAAVNELGLKICDQKLKQDCASSTYLALFVSLFRGIQCWMTFRFDLAWIVSSIMSEPRNYLIWNLVPNHSAIKISRHFNQGRFNRPPSRLACKMSFRRQWRQCRQEGEWWLFEIPARERGVKMSSGAEWRHQNVAQQEGTVEPGMGHATKMHLILGIWELYEMCNELCVKCRCMHWFEVSVKFSAE